MSDLDSGAFRVHGNYCGPGHTGSRNLGGVNFAAQPVDGLDRACLEHDMRYAQGNGGFAADAVLMADAVANRSTDLLPGGPVAIGMAAKTAFEILSGASTYESDGLHFDPIRRTSDGYTFGVPRSVTGGPRARRSISQSMLSRPKRDRPATPPPGPQPRAAFPGDAGLLVGVEPNPGPKPAVANAKRAKRAMAKQQPRAAKNMRVRTAPVTQTAAPSVMVPMTDVRPYYRVEESRGGCTVAALVSIGILSTANGTSSGTNMVPGGVVGSFLIDKDLFVGTQLQYDFERFERWRVRRGMYHFVSSTASSTPGSLWFMPDPDSSDVLPLGAVISPGTISAHRGSVKHTMWSGSAVGPLVLNKEWLWSDSPLVQASSTGLASGTAASSSGGGSDVRLASAGLLNVLNGDSIVAANAGQVGEMFIEIIVEFKDVQRSDLANLVWTARVQAGSGGTLFTYSGTSNNPLNQAISQTVNVGGNGAYEYVYNPRYITPSQTGQMQLPPGTYVMSHALQYANTGTTYTPSYTFSFPTPNSSDFFQSFNVGQSGVIEFTTPPTSPATTGVLAVVNYCQFRLPCVTGINNLCQGNLAVGATFGTNPNVSGIVSYCYRIPTFDSMPIAALYPRGSTATSDLNVTAIRAELIRRLAALPPEPRAVALLADDAKDDESHEWVRIRTSPAASCKTSLR